VVDPVQPHDPSRARPLLADADFRDVAVLIRLSVDGRPMNEHHDVGVLPASINRHVACLRSVTKLGRMLGCMSWYIEIPGVKAERRRQTAGPRLDDVRRVLAATTGDSEAETRARAIILTFVCCGLRVSELCGLNPHDTDLNRGNT